MKSCVTTVKDEEEMKGFADEEDFVKAGGSELLFVQMQERKPMEKQSRITDKVLVSSPFSGHCSRHFDTPIQLDDSFPLFREFLFRATRLYGVQK